MGTPTVTDVRPRSDGARSNGRRALPLRRAWNVPWILLGALLVVGSALTFVVLGGSPERVAVVVLARDVGAGEVVTADDLAVIEVDAGPRARLVAADRRDGLLGRRAVSNLAAGTLLADELLVSAPPIGRGQAVVGVRLDASSLPGPALGSGDAVMVVRTPAPSDLSDPAAPAVWPATVLGTVVADSTAGAVTVVSLRVDPLDAPAIAAAAAADRIRLVVVSSLEDIPPEVLFTDALAGEEVAPEGAR